MAQSAAQASMRRTGALPSGPAFQIVFRRKLWISRRVPQSDMVVAILYHQVLEDFMNNNLITSRETEPDMLSLVAKLASLQIQSRPSLDKTQLSNVEYFKSAVPSAVYPLLDSVSWRTNIMQHYKQIGDLDQNDARKQFLHAAEGLTLFGNSFF